MPSLASFNANNLYLRYRFKGSYPGDTSRKSFDAAEKEVGYLPGRGPGGTLTRDFILWDRTRRDVAALALREPDGTLPDLLCLQEIENLDAMRAFNRHALGGHYPYALLIDGHDERNIDVGVLSRWPIEAVRTHVDARAEGDFVFSRDCLEFLVRTEAGPLTVFHTHLKSKFATGSEAEKRQQRHRAGLRRQAESAHIRALVQARMDGQLDTALFCVLGDFNDVPSSPWLAPLFTAPFLHDVIGALGPEEGWTYFWRSKGQVSRIDHILASPALLARIRGSGRAPHIERGGLGYRAVSRDLDTLPAEVTWTQHDEDHTGLPGVPADSKVSFRFPRFGAVLEDVANNASDHCPVRIWF
jgi:endonuclease/exonuclease/phosphatase family metal-dependent hydrolase